MGLDKTATFAVNLEGNAPASAKTAADAMQVLKDRIDGGTASIREMSSRLKNLRGTDAEVADLKKELTARITAEKQALASATLEQIKAEKAQGILGRSTKALADEKKALEAKTKSVDAAFRAAGGPVSSLRDRLKALRELIADGGGTAALVLGVAAITAAMVAAAVAVGAGFAALARFVVASRDAARSAAIFREALMGGNAQWGRQYGEQVEALARRVPTSRAELDKLGASLTKQAIYGQTWVDSMNAIAQASAALGDDAGQKIESFISRAMVLGRPGLFRLTPQELLGTGVAFEDVANALAKNMGIGVDKARLALFQGRVKLADGAAALRGAVEKNFGAINLRQMLSLEVMARKFGETLDDLTKGVDIEPLLGSFRDLLGVFDMSTQSGNALKTLVSVFGNDFVGAFKAATPFAKQFLYGLIIGAQNLTILYLKARNSIRDMIPADALTRTSALTAALSAGKVAVYAMAGAAAALGVLVGGLAATFVAPFAILAAAVSGAYEGIREYGPKIVDGLIEGIKSRWEALKRAVSGLAEGVKSTFRDALGIHSPSRVFAEFGENTAAGYEEGIDRGSDRARSATANMVAVPGSAGGRGGAASGPITITIPITIQATGQGGQDIADAITGTSVLEQIETAVTKALTSAGIPVMA